MKNWGWREKIIAVVVALGLALIAFFSTGFYKQQKQSTISTSAVDTTSASNKLKADSGGKIISVSPDNLLEGTVLPTQIIKIGFGQQIEGFDPNYHVIIEPSADVEVVLLGDGKTIEIRPKPTFAVGTGYSITLRNNMKFKSSGDERLGNDIRIEFKTLNYRGV